jgi:uncharacterized protein (DUF1684 family)
MQKPSLGMDAPASSGVEQPVLALVGWRRAVAELYAAVRNTPDPHRAHEIWRQGRDDLFRRHPQSPLGEDDRLRETGLPYFPYDPSYRFEVELRPATRSETLRVDTSDGQVRFGLAGCVVIDQLGVGLDVWWLASYGGGLFLPVRDGTAGTESYGGGRYLLDTVKGADLGERDGRLVVDLNFLYHPSCRYSTQWVCPLAPEGNVTRVPIPVGERL